MPQTLENKEEKAFICCRKNEHPHTNPCGREYIKLFVKHSFYE
jgi:hypothetical protein